MSSFSLSSPHVFEEDPPEGENPRAQATGAAKPPVQ